MPHLICSKPELSARQNKKTDANTRAVCGDYISIYDIQRAVADKATVPIYCERLKTSAAALHRQHTN